MSVQSYTMEMIEKKYLIMLISFFPVRFRKYLNRKENGVKQTILEAARKDLTDFIRECWKKSSTIFCSQYEYSEWYDQLGGNSSPLADAIINRIAHDSYIINITSIDPQNNKSMREVYGLDKALRE